MHSACVCVICGGIPGSMCISFNCANFNGRQVYTLTLVSCCNAAQKRVRVVKGYTYGKLMDIQIRQENSVIGGVTLLHVP